MMSSVNGINLAISTRNGRRARLLRHIIVVVGGDTSERRLRPFLRYFDMSSERCDFAKRKSDPFGCQSNFDETFFNLV